MLNMMIMPRVRSHATIKMSGNGTATSLPNTANFYKIAGTTSLHIGHNITMPANNRALVAYTNKYLVTIDASLTSGDIDDIYLGIAVNGTIISNLTSSATTSNPLLGTPYRVNLSLTSVISLTSGQYIEAFMRNASATASATVQDLVMTIVEL